jgi:hypothetical protein
MNIFSRASDYIVRCFELPVEESLFRRTVEVCRVLIGIGMMHRYLDIGGFVVAAPHPGLAERDVLVATMVSAAVTMGLLTPVALLGMLYFTLYTPFGFTIGHQIVTLIVWMLLFAGAGQRWSIDASLLRLPNLSKLFRALYVLEVPFSPRSFGLMRMVGLWLFWTISLAAMSFHFKDELWLEGKVLQILLATPYLTDHADAAAAFRDASPVLYGALGTAAIVVQSTFELFAWPLCLFRWGRIFVAAQWLAFIVVRGVFMNLGYLVYEELVLWLFLFTLRPWAVWNHRVVRRQPQPAPEEPLRPGFRGIVLRAFIASAIAVSSYFTVANAARINLPEGSVTLPFPPKTVLRLFAQWPVDVFNKADMSMGAQQLVIVETDDEGAPVRVVPFLDYQGGRLSYLRNDFMYFGMSLPWQRYTREQQLRTGPGLAFRVGLVDAALRSGDGPHRYAALFFTQELEPFSGYQRWSSPQFRGGFRFEVADEYLKSRKPPTLPSYDLPPGHASQAERLARTWTRVSGLDIGSLPIVQAQP